MITILGGAMAMALCGNPAGITVAGAGWCLYDGCLGIGGKGKSEFNPVDYNSLTAEEQEGLSVLIEYYARATCAPRGGRGAFWNRLDDYNYKLTHENSRKSFMSNNELARQFIDVPMSAPANGAKMKFDPDDRNGFGVHAEMQAVKNTDAHVGGTCLLSASTGAVSLKVQDAIAEAWVNKSKEFVVRVYDTSPDKHSYSQTRKFDLAEVQKLKQELVGQSRQMSY